MARVTAALAAQSTAWTLLVLLLAGLGYDAGVSVRAETRPLAFHVFNKFLNDTAEAKVRDSAMDSRAAVGARQALAEEIVAKILGSSDPINGKTVASFGFGFACFIWDAGIAPEYANLLEVGVQRSTQGRNDGRFAKNGAIVKTSCLQGADVLHRPPERSIGFPCSGGGVVQLQAHTQRGLLLNGIVSYHRFAASGDRGTFRVGGATPSIWLEQFESRLEAATIGSTQDRFQDARIIAKIDLTQVALDFYVGVRAAKEGEKTVESTSARVPGKRPRATKHKGQAYHFHVIAVVPCYGLPQQLPRGYLKSWSSNFLGLAAAGGQIVVDHVHVPMPEDLDLNRPAALTLYIVTVVPAQASYEYPKGPCPECD